MSVAVMGWGLALCGPALARQASPRPGPEPLCAVSTDPDYGFSLTQPVQVGGGVNISVRSLGAVNVQVIMESLGGGGHQTMAAAQLKHITPEAARNRIQTAIDQYREAQKKSGLESESEQKKKDKQ